MQAEDESVIGVSYTLKKKGSDEVIEQVNATEPFVFLMGFGQLLDAFEDNVRGKKMGDSFDFSIDAVDAYGEFDAEASANIPKEVFSVNGQFDAKNVTVGRRIRLEDEEGNPAVGTVKNITDKEVIMDFNHPLAGVDLHFSGKILSIRKATEEELDHGHVHGPGGHHH